MNNDEMRENIAKQTAEYIANGGSIQIIEPCRFEQTRLYPCRVNNDAPWRTNGYLN